MNVRKERARFLDMRAKPGGTAGIFSGRIAPVPAIAVIAVAVGGSFIFTIFYPRRRQDYVLQGKAMARRACIASFLHLTPNYIY